MSTEGDSSTTDERFDDQWTSDIVESYFDFPNDKIPLPHRRESTQPAASLNQNMLTAPPLEKTDSQWSPMSSGLVTPQDSIGYWAYSPDRRRSGRFSMDSNGIYGQNNRWSLGTQLSSVSFAELPPHPMPCEEDKALNDRLQEWNNIDTPQASLDDDDCIFHPDDEIILDPKESLESPIQRASIGSRAPGQEWPLSDSTSKNLSPVDARLRQVQPLASQPKTDRQSLRISTCDPIDEDTLSTRVSSYSLCSDPSYRYPSYDSSIFPKVTNRRSFVESPPEFLSQDGPWPLGASASSQNGPWSQEKPLPPTPRSRGVSFSLSRCGISEEYPHNNRVSANYDTMRTFPITNPLDRPASWNPRCDVPADLFDLNLDKAILGTSLARDHRLARKAEECVDDQQQTAFESIFSSLKVSEPTSNRSSVTNGSAFRESKNYTWTSNDEYHRRSSMKEQSSTSQMMNTNEAQRRNIMNRIINERNLNPVHFEMPAKHARYFVIKSYNEDDVHKSLKFNIWASTEIGNRRLDKAYRESHRSGPIYLFFSVNASGQFCGMARMASPVDYTNSSSVWTQTDKWKGRMEVRWIFVKDIPNSQLRHIRVWNNENKPVTNSRDTQELPPEAGLAMLRIFADYPPKSSVILSNLVAAEMKEETTAEETKHTSLQSIDEPRQYNHRQSFRSDEYSTPDVYPRQSWQSNGEETRSARQSYQLGVQDYSRHPAPSRRNTISVPGLIGSTNRLSSSATPTSGMRTLDYLSAPTFLPDNPSSTTNRSMLTGFSGLGDVHTTNRYPPFRDRNSGGNVRYDEVRYF